MSIVCWGMQRRDEGGFQNENHGEITNAAKDCTDWGANQTEAECRECAIELHRSVGRFIHFGNRSFRSVVRILNWSRPHNGFMYDNVS